MFIGGLNITYWTFSISLFILMVLPLTYCFYTKKEYKRIILVPIYKDLRIWGVCLSYSLILGFMYDYSIDWSSYVRIFNDVGNGNYRNTNSEWGFIAFNKLLSEIGLNHYSAFIVEYFIWILSICLVAKKDRKALLFILPFIFIGMRRGLNLSRQFFAMSFYNFAVYYILKNKTIKYTLFSIVACSIHTSAIPFVVVSFFLKYLKIPSKYIVIPAYLVCFTMVQAFSEYIISLVTYADMIIGKGYNSDFITRSTFVFEEKSFLTRSLYAIRDLALITGYYYLKQNEKLTNTWNVLFVIGIYSCFFRMFTDDNQITSRFFLYLITFSHVCLGYLSFYVISNLRKVPIWITGLVFFSIAYYFLSFYHRIPLDYINGIYVKYEFF